jgi:hypothetical protein
MARQQVVARKLFGFLEVVGTRHVVNITVTPNFVPLILSLESPPDYRTEQNQCSFPKHRADKPNHFQIHYLVGRDWKHLELVQTVENFHHVQPFGEGQWLLVRARAEDEQDCNAHVYDSRGRLLRSFHAGDAIQDVQVTERDNIWVSYFDESHATGLVCFDPQGKPCFRFDELKAGTIVDCYALNVCSDREVWFYYYTDFALGKLVDRKLANSWKLPIEGSRGFAVDGDRVLLARGYAQLARSSDERNLLFLGKLDTLDFQKFQPTNEQGEPLEQYFPFGRRNHLYLDTQDALYLVDLRHLSQRE